MVKTEKGAGSLADEMDEKSVWYFLAAQGAKTEMRQRIFKLPWRFRARWFLWVAVCSSNQLERLVGLAGMSIEQLRWRAIVLFEARQYQKALRCLNEVFSRNILTPEKRVWYEILGAEILSALGRKKEAFKIFNSVWRRRAQLPPETMEDIQCSLVNFLSETGNSSASLAVYLQGTELANWRESARN